MALLNRIQIITVIILMTVKMRLTISISSMAHKHGCGPKSYFNGMYSRSRSYSSTSSLFLNRILVDAAECQVDDSGDYVFSLNPSTDPRGMHINTVSNNLA